MITRIVNFLCIFAAEWELAMAYGDWNRMAAWGQCAMLWICIVIMNETADVMRIHIDLLRSNRVGV